MTAGDPASLQINLLGHRVRLTGPEEEIAPLRASLFTRCHEPADSPPVVAYEIEAAGEGYRVRRAGEGGEPEYEADDPSDLFWWLDNTLCSAALKSATDVLQIHGAAAVREGRAILLLGDSYAGKTSLTVHLLRRGFGFLTEEVIIIDPRTKRLLPFPRNLLVREGALQGDAELARICRATAP